MISGSGNFGGTAVYSKHADIDWRAPSDDLDTARSRIPQDLASLGENGNDRLAITDTQIASAPIAPVIELKGPAPNDPVINLERVSLAVDCAIAGRLSPSCGNAPDATLTGPAPALRQPADTPPEVLTGPEVFASIPIISSSRAIKALVATSRLTDERLPHQCFELQSSYDCAMHIPDRWRSFVSQLKGLPAIAKARRVNAEVNASVAYRSDMENYGKFDYWAPAIETMARSAGDCEDLAILKMWLLINLGVDPQNLYVVVVRSRHLTTQHAILAFRIDGKFMILDNLRREIAAADDIADYAPVFSVSARSVWLHGFPASHDVAELERRRIAQH